MLRIKYLLPLTLVFVLLRAPSAHAAVSDWQKGFSVIPTSQGDFATSGFYKSLDNLRGIGANYVTLVIPYHQDSVASTAIYPGSDTPTDEALISGIGYAHAHGLAVNLSLHLEAADTNWRAYINPDDRTAWFANYSEVLSHYAVLGQQNNVEMITLGAELIDMASDNLNSTNTSNWEALIANVRKVYSGKLTYDANWGGGFWNDEADHVKFWAALDYIGISEYYHIGGATKNTYTADSLAAAWGDVDASQISRLHSMYGKPVLFTEVGYRSVDGALTHPASWQMSGGVDQQEQSDGYQSLFSYWNSVPFFAGVQFWDWSSNPNAGGPGDSGFTVQGKLAQETVTNWFTNGNNNPPPPTEPAGKAIIYISDLPWKYQQNGWGPVERDSSNGEAGANDGQKIKLNGITYDKGIGANAKSKIIFDLPPNCTKFSSDIGVDDEITAKGSVNFTVWRDDTGQKVYDSGLLTYSSPTETVSLDITGWKAMGLIIYDGGNGPGHDHGDWADAKLTCTETNSDPAPPADSNPPPQPGPIPPSVTNAHIDLWWPVDGSNLSGTVPFKAMVEGLDISQYDMYWQVDGDVLNPMGNSNADWPHKEALVDVTGWSWRNTGPYTLTFVAKDPSGNIIADKDSNIYVAH